VFAHLGPAGAGARGLRDLGPADSAEAAEQNIVQVVERRGKRRWGNTPAV